MPNDFDHAPQVGGEAMGANNKVGAQGTEPTADMNGLAAVSMGSKNNPVVNESTYSFKTPSIGGMPMGK